MSVQALLNRFLGEPEPQPEDLRLERLQEADIPAVDSSLTPFVFVPRRAPSGKARTVPCEPMFRVETACDVYVITSHGVDNETGAVRIVSRSVIGLIMPCFLARGTEVVVRFGSVIVFGNVRRSSAAGSTGFYVGVRLQHVAEIFSPEPKSQL